MMPAANAGGPAGSGRSGNTVVRIFVPTAQQNALVGCRRLRRPPATDHRFLGGIVAPPVGIAPGAAPASPPPPGSQMLAINVNGPAAISQTLAVGPNAGGCAPATGGTNCQLALALPAGTYMGTIGVANTAASTAIAFTVTPNGQNVFGVTLSGVAAQVALVPASSLSAQNAQGGIDLYGSGRHPMLVEAFDANQNVIVGNAPGNLYLSQAGGALAVGITQPASTTPNLFYVSSNGVGNTNSAFLMPLVRDRIKRLDDMIGEIATSSRRRSRLQAGARRARGARRRAGGGRQGARSRSSSVSRRARASPPRRSRRKPPRGLRRSAGTSNAFMVLRVAISGRTSSPELFPTMEVLGKEITRRRLRKPRRRSRAMPKPAQPEAPPPAMAWRCRGCAGSRRLVAEGSAGGRPPARRAGKSTGIRRARGLSRSCSRCRSTSAIAPRTRSSSVPRRSASIAGGSSRASRGGRAGACSATSCCRWS